MPAPEFLQDIILFKLATVALNRTRFNLSNVSKTLMRAATILRETDNRIVIYIPHYWARFVHDGRLPFKSKKIMVWFRDPAMDPRGKTPERKSQVRRLTKEQYLAGLALNRAADPSGQNPHLWPMIVTNEIKNPTAPVLFFDNDKGMVGFKQEAKDIILSEIRNFLKAEGIIGKPQVQETKVRV